MKRRLVPEISRNDQAGFSLLEVLVAFSILSISLGVLYQVFSSSLNNSALSADYSRAMIIAESQLALVMQDVPLREMSDQGEIDERYQWQVEVVRYQEDKEQQGRFAPYQVTSRVNWRDGVRQKEYRLTTLRLGKP